MIVLLIPLLLQIQIALPQRSELVNPAAHSPVPKKLLKDYDKLWQRFVTATDDQKVFKELDKMSSKDADFVPALIVESYIDLYAGRRANAEEKFRTVLARHPDDPVALFYLAEFSYERNDFVKAAELYSRLLSGTNPFGPTVEMKSQRSFLLALDSLVQSARRAASENRPDEVAKLYNQALALAPEKTASRSQLAELFLGKPDGGVRGASENGVAGSNTQETEKAERERWGDQIERFREIRHSESLTREQLAALLASYFPELGKSGEGPVITDIEDSWAKTAILSVVKAELLDCMGNHAFQPSRTLTRSEFAGVISRLTRFLGLSPEMAAPIRPLDVVPDSALSAELQPVLSYRLMSLDNSGNFNVSANVSGEEAVNIAEKLLGLLQKNGR